LFVFGFVRFRVCSFSGSFVFGFFRFGLADLTRFSRHYPRIHVRTACACGRRPRRPRRPRRAT
jgi:hypothetical protein